MCTDRSPCQKWDGHGTPCGFFGCVANNGPTKPIFSKCPFRAYIARGDSEGDFSGMCGRQRTEGWASELESAAVQVSQKAHTRVRTKARRDGLVRSGPESGSTKIGRTLRNAFAPGNLPAPNRLPP